MYKNIFRGFKISIILILLLGLSTISYAQEDLKILSINSLYSASGDYMHVVGEVKNDSPMSFKFLTKEFLGLSALFLSIINGSILLRNYLRDKPKLIVHPINPNIYQWWFKLPDKKIKNKLIKKYGFLVYIGIVNRGLRKVSLESWKLYIKTVELKQVELDPISIPEPRGNIGKSGHLKFLPVLGQKGPLFDVSTFIDSGNCISGIAYYVLKIYDKEIYNPIIKDEKISGKLIIKDVFGGQSNCDISFSKKPLEIITSIVEDIEKIV